MMVIMMMMMQANPMPCQAMLVQRGVPPLLKMNVKRDKRGGYLNNRQIQNPERNVIPKSFRLPSSQLFHRMLATAITASVSGASYPPLFNPIPSTPKFGTSTSLSPKTPSSLLRSTKLLHSLTTRLHSASALPEYTAPEA